jgi:hypothetical protein
MQTAHSQLITTQAWAGKAQFAMFFLQVGLKLLKKKGVCIVDE